jgi:hypothetical protein
MQHNVLTFDVSITHAIYTHARYELARAHLLFCVKTSLNTQPYRPNIGISIAAFLATSTRSSTYRQAKMWTTSTLSRLPVLVFCVSLTPWSNFVEATCYHPNGTETTDNYHSPCSNDTSNPLSSICCANKRPNPSGGLATMGDTSDTCLPNGICMNQKKLNENDRGTNNGYFREECTSKDWQSGNCPNFCLNNVSVLLKRRSGRLHACFVGNNV